MRKVLAFVLVACTASVVKTDIIQLNNVLYAPKTSQSVTLEYNPEEFNRTFYVDSWENSDPLQWEYLLESGEQKPKLTLHESDTIKLDHLLHSFTIDSKSIQISFRAERSIVLIELKFGRNLQSLSRKMTRQQQNTVQDFVDTIQSGTAQKEIDLKALITVLDRVSSANRAQLDEEMAWGKGYTVWSTAGFIIRFREST